MIDYTEMLPRQHYFVKDLSTGSARAVAVHPTRADFPYANCFGSLLADGSGLHAPTLDIDLPCALIPSSTPGHFHLLIDKPMSWEKYTKLLSALMEAGILEEGYVGASLLDGATILRKPGVTK